jgi:DNA mismatch repair protein MutL
MPIHVLSEEVASQIAAGEVVERPASVVKELLENALDAKSKDIRIIIEAAGQRMIEVTDDGMGIPTEELSLAISRHATSKLRTADDLFHIQTLGFRGEALASIASVSQFTLISRTRESLSGTRIQVEGGKTSKGEQVSAPVGTQVRVENLFYNVPARLKFLKKDVTERHTIDALVTRYAIAYPEVRFRLNHDQSQALHTTGRGDAREVLANLYGVEIARQMVEVNIEEDGHKLSGFASPASLTRSNRREITFFVNGRWIQDIALNAAFLQAYHTLLMVGRYPMAILFLQIPPEEVDVNVHPAKAEVRFRRQDLIFSLVQRGVKRALLAYSPLPELRMTTWQIPGLQKQIDPAWDMAAESKTIPQPMQAQIPVVTTGRLDEVPRPSGYLPILRLIGQIGNTYIVAEGPDGLYLIDQHAAHERVLFERFLDKRPDPIPAQALLEGVNLELAAGQARLLTEYLPIINKIGFQVELFGVDTFRIRAIPAFLGQIDPAAAIRVVVEDFEEDEAPLQSELEARLVARICKRAAVKGGQTLSKDEQEALVRDLEACQSPRSCPHGRPTMIHLSVDLLERQFGRRGSR